LPLTSRGRVIAGDIFASTLASCAAAGEAVGTFQHFLPLLCSHDFEVFVVANHNFLSFVNPGQGVNAEMVTFPDPSSVRDAGMVEP